MTESHHETNGFKRLCLRRKESSSCPKHSLIGKLFQKGRQQQQLLLHYRRAWWLSCRFRCFASGWSQVRINTKHHYYYYHYHHHYFHYYYHYSNSQYDVANQWHRG